MQRTIPCFDDPEVGCVQTRWGHLNPDTSHLTQAQALGIDGHFIVEQTARARIGAFLNFNGTAGVWRRAAMDDVGGWQGDTLTEDLDLSYRAQLAGWRIAYLPDVVTPAEVPVQVDAFKRQQFRWAKGSIQTAHKLLGQLWRRPGPTWRKVAGTLHLTKLCRASPDVDQSAAALAYVVFPKPLALFRTPFHLRSDWSAHHVLGCAAWAAHPVVAQPGAAGPARRAGHRSLCQQFARGL
ncbi:MAG: glycosyltransferase [Caldilineaceae bacterium]|nr:glycosyltransferase [Caldilineaceae bacterium]